MEFALDELPARNRYKLLSSLVIPRPIAWVTTENENGTINAAPFSYFNVLGDSPPLVVISVGERPEGGPKDTAANLERTGECVVHLVSEAVAKKMNATSAALPTGTSEVTHAQLATAPSVKVAVPRLADAPAALEGQLAQAITVGKNRILLIEIVHVSVDDAFVGDDGNVRAEEMNLIGRVNGPSAYTRTNDRFQMERP